MNKPTMKTRLAIKEICPFSRRITFCTDVKYATELEEFGDVDEDIYENTYWLVVDARYDWDAVLRYVKEMEKSLRL